MIYEFIELHPILKDVKLVAIGQSQLKYTDFQISLRPAIILCPGGGYLTIHDDEAEYVALKFVSLGYMVFILHYSTAAPYAYFPAPMKDLENAITFVFENASKYAVDPTCISLLGLSTGGHLVSSVNYIHSHKRNDIIKSKALIYPILSLTSLVDFDINHTNSTFELMFSAIIGKSRPQFEQLSIWNSEQFITSGAAPTFICAYSDDAYCSPEVLSSYVSQLNKKRIPNNVLLVSSKKHGNPTVDPENNWITAYHNWLLTLK